MGEIGPSPGLWPSECICSSRDKQEGISMPKFNSKSVINRCALGWKNVYASFLAQGFSV